VQIYVYNAPKYVWRHWGANVLPRSPSCNQGA